MKKIKPNSLEAVIFFTLYICGQDDLIAKEELEQLSIEIPLLQKLYLDIYGEYMNEDFEMLIQEVSQAIAKEKYYSGNKISTLETNTFSKLITDPKMQDISLIVARHAASADGFHKLENNKYTYWSEQWGL
tara:strand:+ start:941 stop:1333 length:393 start_codon:yes stop_codon:yes gene_type:complete